MKNLNHRFLVVSAALALTGTAATGQEATKPAPAKQEPAKPEPAKTEPAKPAPAATEPATQPAKETAKSPAKETATTDAAYVLGHTLKSIDGKDVNLADYKGKVVLIVNVASKCGYTKQYAGLEKLYKDKAAAGLVVLGIPANEFGGQEPGTDSQIAEFCKNDYGVTFPMLGKVSAKGPNQHALFKQLSAQPAPIGGDPKWNFTKFLVDREGKVVARFDSAVKPEDKELTSKVDALLAPAKGK
ncbi:MAG: redoxin family protein [Phycisphaerales bacterium]